jgi:putative membrane protein
MVTNDKPIRIPSWAARYISHDDLAAVAAAVLNAEIKTSAEIVPMVVRRSTVCGHIPGLLALIYALIVVAFWSLATSLELSHWLVVPVVVVVGVLFLQLSRLPAVFRLLTDDADIELQTLQRAELEFYRANMKETSGSTGILLFLSLAEQEAVVLADQAISEILPRDTWKRICETLVAAAKNGTLTRGLTDAVTECGRLCAPHFPPVDTNPNELKDALIFKE